MKISRRQSSGNKPHHLTLLVAYSGALHSKKLKKKIKIVDEKASSTLTSADLKAGGRLNIVGMGAWYSLARPIPFAAHHFLHWFLALIALGYFVANSLFA